jgi:hypothetical protein
MTSSKKSVESANWDENWSLLRKLFPEWNPTDEMIREVWFRSYDLPHGLSGPQTVNHDALRESIVEHRKTTAYPRPDFLTVSDLYRLAKQRTTAEIFRARMTPERREDLKKEIDQEHERRVEKILRWDLSRINAAREQVAKLMPGIGMKSGDPQSWSAVYSGLVIAADERLRNGEASEGSNHEVDGARGEGHDREEHDEQP